MNKSFYGCSTVNRDTPTKEGTSNHSDEDREELTDIHDTSTNTERTKKIDHHKSVVMFLDQHIRGRYQLLMQDSVMKYKSAVYIVADRATA
ncbi:hypothetical protein PsorP6_014235 [Peronosclerospora sorghi]|uniref:Uncharacterized protein n=1 Tax=Peronosclerospora sorghi TaxID=230839 RepID=A0ACC0VJU2_9STRA|nr:hypothetical protein PsorP6_014235 [Peronosclerospora sorghi]